MFLLLLVAGTKVLTIFSEALVVRRTANGEVVAAEDMAAATCTRAWCPVHFPPLGAVRLLTRFLRDGFAGDFRPAHDGTARRPPLLDVCAREEPRYADSRSCTVRGVPPTCGRPFMDGG